MALSDATDSYFEYVAGRMATINPDRKMIGIADASDWPPKKIFFEAFYLILLGEKPLGKQFWSAEIPVLSFGMQWTWLIKGTDLQTGLIGRSRGDRYRTNMAMRQELLKATFPWFTQKLSWSVQGNTPTGLALKSSPLTPSEYMWWTPPEFANRQDKDSGVLYGAATVWLVDMTESITS